MTPRPDRSGWSGWLAHDIGRARTGCRGRPDEGGAYMGPVEALMEEHACGARCTAPRY